MEGAEHKQKWANIIETRQSMFRLNLKELWEYKDLLRLLVKRDYITFYKQTILGPFWFFIQPLLTTMMYVLIFHKLAGLKTDGIPPTLFYMTGIICWNYFADCLTKTSGVFKDNANVFGKVYFPRLVIPLSIVISSLVRFAVQLLLLVLFMLYFAIFTNDFHFRFDTHLLFFPVLVVLMAFMGLALGLIISAMTTKYRDLTFLVTFGVQLYMYATPVIYSLGAAPEKYKRILELNPLSPIIEGMRLGILGVGEFNTHLLLYAIGSIAVLTIIGVLIFNKTEKDFIDTV